jgi:hypothetical protein
VATNGVGAQTKSKTFIFDYANALGPVVGPTPPLPRLASNQLTGEGVRAFLSANPVINSPARLIAALDGLQQQRFKDNWILMARSESNQTGTALSPRLILPSQDAREVFAFSLTTHPDFPHADPNKVEFIHFETATNRFRFHEINLSMGAASVSVDASGCAECHAGRPNWDAYDSWAGMLPFNRDRVYKGSLDAAALRNLFNLLNKTGAQREILEQLNLPASMVRTSGGPSDGHVNFPALDGGQIVNVEPRPTLSMPNTTPITANYPPDPQGGTVVVQGGLEGSGFFVLRNSTPSSGDQGRGVDLFDHFTGFNAKRIAQELIGHPRSPVDVRPIALAIALDCIIGSELTPTAQAFFNARNRVASLSVMENDTFTRRHLLPKLKADLQQRALSEPTGLIQGYGDQTELSRANDIGRVRQELFRRPQEGFILDTVHTGRMIDREIYSGEVAKFRYFLEPLGVPVDKWSLSVHGRSRTYTFADVLPTYKAELSATLGANLNITSCSSALSSVRTEFSRLPSANAAPRYEEVQRIFNRNCLECHGSFRADRGRRYEPFLSGPSSYDELLSPQQPASPRVVAGNLTSSRLYQRIISTSNPMPPASNGPPLSGSDIDVIRRWIETGALR